MNVVTYRTLWRQANSSHTNLLQIC